MIFPPLIRLLVVHYGWRGAMFVIGAVQMNAVAACALYRPVKSTISSNPDRTAARDVVVMDVLHGRGNVASEIETETLQDCSTQNRLLKYLSFLRLFTNIPLMLSLLAGFVYAMGWVTNFTHMPARSKEAGWSDDQSAALLTIFAVLAMVSRSTHGWFVDRRYIGVFKLQLGVLFGASLVTFLNPVSDSYAFLAAYMVLLGLSFGVASSMFFVVLRKLVGEAEVPSAISLLLASFCLANGTGPVLAGKH